MKNILNLYKKRGETPLQRVEEFRENNPEYCWEKLTYAGRLDPVAEGVLLTLSGKECKNKEKYTDLDKEYEFKVLFGIGTDTYDILGILKKVDDTPKDLKQKIEAEIKNFKGIIKQKYPPFSSKVVEGKPLFEWAKKGKIEEIQIPEREIEIFDLALLEEDEIPIEEVLNEIEKIFETLNGDFRQEEILKSWKGKINKEKLPLLKFNIKCSSGTYVRETAFRIGEKIGVPACVFSIKRKKVGEYGVEDSIR